MVAPLNPALQIVHPRHRLELFLEKEELLWDFSREFPEKKSEIGGLYQRALKDNSFLDGILSEYISPVPRSFGDSMKIRMARMEAMVTREVLFASRFSRALPKNSSPRNLLETAFFLLSNLQITDTIPLVVARLLLLPLRGIYYLQGGKQIFVRCLEERFESLGGDLLRGGDVADIRPGAKVEMRLRQGGRETTIVGKRLLMSTKSAGWRVLLAQDRRFRGLQSSLDDPAGTLYPFTIHLGIHEKGIPERMSEYAVVISDGQGLPQGHPVFLELSAAGDRDLAPPGRRSLSVTVLLDRPPAELEDGALEAVSRSLLTSLRNFLPFLEDNIDLARIPDSVLLNRRRAPVLSPKYRFKKMPELGIFAKTGRTPLKNILMTGGRMLPGLGFEGEVLSGIQAARLSAGGLGA
jgi:phytoene dehydrogenase-like protein